MNKIVAGFLQRIYEIRHNSKKCENAVLMFHEVVNVESEAKGSLYITKEEFIEIMQTLKNETKSGFISPNDMSQKEKGILVTFDDVYKNIIYNAVPYLNDNKIPFTLFITHDLLDKEGYITSQELSELMGNPLCTIGYHTKTHPLLRSLSVDHAKEECDATSFEKILGARCEYFAYPYGSVFAISKRNQKTIKDLNYKLGFSTLHATTNKKLIKRNPFYIPRLNVTSKTYMSVIKKIKNKI